MGGAFSISKDLVPYVNGHLALLYHVSRDPSLTTAGSPSLATAIAKYKIFLTLRAHGLAKVTTKEVEWIWHVHRLHPIDYIADCNQAFGFVVPSQHTKMKKKFKPLPDKANLGQYFNMDTFENTKPMPFDIEKVFNNMFQPRVDLAAAAVRQKSFLDQVKGFYGCGNKLFYKLQKDYLLFLRLFKISKEVLVPTLGIDLLWHTHMRFPEIYGKDTKAFCGRVLNHDDDIPSERLETQLDTTAKAWKRAYRKTYFMTTSSATAYRAEESIAFQEGYFYTFGAWGWSVIEGDPSYCDAQHYHAPSHDDSLSHSPDNFFSCSGGFSCGGSSCGGGGCGGGGSACGSSCGGGGGGCGSSCGGGCGGGGCGGGGS